MPRGRKKAETLIRKPVMFHIRLPAEQKERLALSAKKYGMQMSEYFRYVLLEHFKEEEREARESRLPETGT